MEDCQAAVTEEEAVRLKARREAEQGSLAEEEAVSTPTEATETAAAGEAQPER